MIIEMGNWDIQIDFYFLDHTYIDTASKLEYINSNASIMPRSVQNPRGHRSATQLLVAPQLKSDSQPSVARS